MRHVFLFFLFLLSMNIVSTADDNLPRYPTIEQAEAYLLANVELPEYFSQFYWWETEGESLLYADVNGDGEEDLVATGYRFVAVMFWRNNAYTEPFAVFGDWSARNPYSKTSLEDWTFDSIPEIVFDDRSAYSGSGQGGEIFEKTIIHCQMEACFVAWNGVLTDLYWQYGTNVGMRLFQTETTLEESVTGIFLETISTDFAIECAIVYCQVTNDPRPSNVSSASSLTGSSLRKRYQWQDYQFVEISSEVIAEPAIIEPVLSLESVNSEGVQAQIVDNLRYEMYLQGGCELHVDGHLLGERFYCNHQYLKVEWRELVPGAGEELILQWIYGHEQHLKIYQLVDGGIHEIAYFVVPIAQVDSFGVRTEDFDMDGEIEIVAIAEPDWTDCLGAYCWYTLFDNINIYEWNGTSFEFAYSVPR